MERPLVSVLMTCWNREKYIGAAIESVLASGYTHFEFIICDDCSADSTFDIAQKYAAKDSRIQLYRNEKNLGDYNNRNKAASYAKGKYLKYLDSDDLMYPYTLDNMVYYLENNPGAALAFTAAHIHYSKPELLFPLVFTPEQSYKAHYLQGGFFYSGPGGIMVKRSVFEQFNGFSGRRFIGDLELLMKISLEYPVLMVQPAMIWWRQHDEQEEKYEFRDATMIAQRYRLMSEMLEQSPLSVTEKKTARLSIDKMMARHIIRQAVAKKNYKTAVEMKKIAGFNLWQLAKAFNISNKIRSLIPGQG
jgi:glycosyltransferase involved in cell wall biosynthesis